MQRKPDSPWFKVMFKIAIFFSALTGFAQMPIFKRYYIADLPGLGWLAEFYITYALHYISAAVLIALIAYQATDHWLCGRHRLRITRTGYICGTLLLMILTSGILLLFRNLPGYRFSPQLVIALDFTHLGLVVIFLLAILVSRLMNKKWSENRIRDKRLQCAEWPGHARN